MNINDVILHEVWDAIRNPDDYVTTARKLHPIAWTLGIVMWSLVGVLQMLLWVITIIPALINKWVMNWRY